MTKTTTVTATIAKAVCLITRRGYVIFNDKMKCGDRSLKVGGWTKADYLMAKQMLESAGCRVKLVEIPWGFGDLITTRLHIIEPARKFDTYVY